MKLIQMAKTVALTAVLGASAFAAPGLTVSGSEIRYNGQKIFFSGMNLAWINYNSDVAADPLDQNAWRKAVQDIRSAGGNSIRWWLFNNMSISPTINPTTNLVTGLPANTITNMQTALDIAEEYGVMVSMCLFSHNLMDPTQWGLYTGEKLNITANHKLFDDDGTQAFITNALIPVLTAIGNHNALMTWELFNEPEGMIDGWFTQTETRARIQKFSNKVAAAIKANAPGTLVSNGIHTTDALQHWSDAALVAAGGQATGTLDFFQVHFYPEHQTEAQSPFHHPYSFWNITKPLIIGEFSAAGWNKTTYPAYKVSTKTTVELYRYAIDNGYAGALAWDYRGFNDNVAGTAVTHNFAAAKPGMEAIWATDSNLIKIKSYTPAATGGNGVMQVNIDGIASEISLERVRNMNLSAATAITLKARVVSGTQPLSIRMVAKVSNSWTWTENATFCSIAASTDWTTCTFTIAGFGGSMAEVKSLLIQSFTVGFTGNVQFDDIVAGSTVIDNFDTEFDLWSIAAAMTGAADITGISTVYVGTTTPVLSFKNSNRSIHLQGSSLNLQGFGAGKLEIYNLNGERLMSVQTSERNPHVFLGNLERGIYLARHSSVQGALVQRFTMP